MRPPATTDGGDTLRLGPQTLVVVREGRRRPDVPRALGAPRAMTRSASAPGRVNLMGEHTDYNDGFVLPLGLSQRVAVTVGGRDERGDGDAYVRAAFAVAGVPEDAVAIASDIPAGAGLASSAALLVALLRALRPELEPLALARLAHRAETEGVGVQCGIMDHVAAALGVPGEALLVDCRSLAVQRIPCTLDIRVHDSGVRHANATSGYAQRRAECGAAARALGVHALRDATSWDALPAPLDRRARHVIEENARVHAAAQALRAGDGESLGRLFDASHASQRDLFAVSVPEVDALVARLRAGGALGARLTGGGFGGSVVAVHPAPS